MDANCKYKVSVRDTISALGVGESVKIRNSNAAYANVYNTAQRIRKATGQLYTVNLITNEGMTRVTRVG